MIRYWLLTINIININIIINIIEIKYFGDLKYLKY